MKGSISVYEMIICIIVIVSAVVFASGHVRLSYWNGVASANETALMIADELLTKENDMADETKLTVGALTDVRMNCSQMIDAAYAELEPLSAAFGAYILQPNYEPGSYVGIYIDLDGSVDYLKLAVASSNAKEKVEVRVAFDGIAKDFTFDEFFNRLGFDAETNP